MLGIEKQYLLAVVKAWFGERFTLSFLATIGYFRNQRPPTTTIRSTFTRSVPVTVSFSLIVHDALDGAGFVGANAQHQMRLIVVLVMVGLGRLTATRLGAEF